MDPNQKYFHDFIPSRHKFEIKIRVEWHVMKPKGHSQNEKEKRYEHGKNHCAQYIRQI